MACVCVHTVNVFFLMNKGLTAAEEDSGGKGYKEAADRSHLKMTILTGNLVKSLVKEMWVVLRMLRKKGPGC